VDAGPVRADNAWVSPAGLLLVLAAAAASTACASTAGRHAPRPFPTAPAPAVAAPAPAPAATRPAAVTPEAEPSAPAAAAEAPPLVFPGAPSAEAGARARLAADVLSTALSLRGIPYRLGGSDLTGFDCSGFVQYVLARHAVAMPRTVAQQFIVGERTREVEAGDLVFFQTVGRKASHVGIALDRETFVHAPNSRGVVRVERLDAGYWSTRFLGARRVL
jgi:cell wall-associated NlpC family hydrolase